MVFQDRIGVSISKLNPVLIGVGVGGVTFIIGNVVNGGVAGQLPHLVLVGVIMLFTVSIAAGATAWFFANAKRMSGRSLLTFDFKTSSLFVPQGRGRESDLLIPSGEIADFDYDVDVTIGSKGREIKRYRVLVQTIGVRGQNGRHVLVDFGNEKGAVAFQSWCRERLFEMEGRVVNPGTPSALSA